MSSNKTKRPETMEVEEDGDEKDSKDVKPPSKRQKTSASSESDDKSNRATAQDLPSLIDFSLFDQNGSGSFDLKSSKIDELVDSMIEQLRDIKNKENEQKGNPALAMGKVTSLSQGLLMLRTWQRDLLHRCSILEQSCQEQCEARRQHEQIWGSFQYEKSYLQEEIATVQNFSMPYLDQVLHEHKQQNKQSGNDSNESSTSPILLQLEPNNPSHRASILEYLQSEIQKRAKLEKERDKLKAKLRIMQRKCQQEKSSLKQLPQHLATFEEATKPLQDWFSLPFIGSARSGRLQLAQNLPAPLFTLFVSLQEYLDIMDAVPCPSESPEVAENNDGENSEEKMSLRIVPIIGGKGFTLSEISSEGKQLELQQPHEVQLSLPVPDIAAMVTNKTTAGAAKSQSANSTNEKKRSVIIHFQYNHDGKSTHGLQLIKTTASGCPTGLDQVSLLSRLFPGHDQEEEHNGFYRWSHYLGGIHVVSHTTTAKSVAAKMSTVAVKGTSIRTIVKTLQRRIRANATLKYILQSLCQHHKIPASPMQQSSVTNDSTISRSSASWQVSFSQQQEQAGSKKASSIFTYDVYCKKSQSRNNMIEFRATVEIDNAQYPAIPPVWRVFPDPPDSVSPAKYNVTWSILEQDVNFELLRSQGEASEMLFSSDSKNGPGETDNDVVMTDASNGQNEEVESKEQESGESETEDFLLFAEWILVHQLNRLLEKWEQVVTTTASSASAGLRAVRGRDRIPLSLFESDKS